MNKIDDSGHIAEITEEAIQKFKDMSLLLGVCIDNTSQIESSVGMALQVDEIMLKIKSLMGGDQGDEQKSRDEELTEMCSSIKKVRQGYGDYMNQANCRPKML